MLQLPVLRAGQPYRSLDRAVLRHVASGEPVAEVSQANAGLIARDLLSAEVNRQTLAGLTVQELLRICREAARHFMESDLPVGEASQSPEDYIHQLSATTGMPHTLGRSNMAKIHFVLDQMETVLAGLTRGLDLEALDRGWTVEDERCVSYLRQADALGVVLPSNSPGVHSLWIPSLALKVPLVLKPGGQEPWTPFRILQALMRAGCPPQALSFYPSSHAGATEILLRCGRSMLFGDRSTVRAWAHDSRVQLHGPGWSKVILGADQMARWQEHLELMASSVAANGGRSCVNASGIWLAESEPGQGREIAEALARRLAEIEARPLDDPQAEIAAFSNPEVARRISELIDRQLQIPGAMDLTAGLRQSGRLVELGGCSYLLPTVIWCEDPSHPLVEAEFLFPCVSVVELPEQELLRSLGPSLVVSAVTEDPELIRQLMECRRIERLNLGSIPTCQVVWDQPHEGNLFEHVYRRRAFQAPDLNATQPGGDGDRVAIA